MPCLQRGSKKLAGASGRRFAAINASPFSCSFCSPVAPPEFLSKLLMLWEMIYPPGEVYIEFSQAFSASEKGI